MKCSITINDNSEESIIYYITWYKTEKSGYRVVYTLFPNSM